MALEKQNISIPFAQGIDTKTDPRQLQPGKLTALTNSVFNENLLLQKRNGYKSLTGTTYAASSGVGLATYKNELITFDNNNLYSFNPENQSQVNKGPITGLDINVSAVYRSTNNQTIPNSAYNAAGRVFLYIWNDSAYGNSYSVISQDTGTIITSGSLASNYLNPQPFSLGNYLILVVVDNSASPNRLVYFSFPIYQNTIQGPSVLSTKVNASNPNFTGLVISNKLYLSWYASDPGVRTTVVDSTLTQLATTLQSGENASGLITIFTNSPPYSSGVSQDVWVSYWDGTANLKYFVLSLTSLMIIVGPTLINNGTLVLKNVCGYAINNQGFILCQVQNTYSYSSVRTDYITYFTVNLSGVAAGNFQFLFGVGLFSNIVIVNGIAYCVVTYGPANGQGFEPTYFIIGITQIANSVTLTPIVQGKIAYTNGGGYTSALTSINQLTPTQYQFTYLFKDLLESSNTAPNNVYTQTGVNSAIFDFNSINKCQTIELGNTLNINGGLGWMYDGSNVVENNFHLFPEDMGATTGSSGAAFGPGTYNYIATYEWVDNQGNTHRSAPSPAISNTMISTSGFASIKVPCLRLTQKQNVTINIYRTAPSINVGTYYKITPITNPIASSANVDSITWIDNKPDSAIIGNELLYTTGGVVENSGAPASNAITIYNNRLIMVDSEDKNRFWYSKQTLENTPVEMSDLFTFFVDPRFGFISAVSVMDDKLILFKASAIFYIVGQGPDATGANNDFSEAVFITSVVGTINPKSIVLVEQGLMFQTNKGIYLLDRGLRLGYIGAPVEDFNSRLITSAFLIQNTRQVRFTLDNGTCLLYDYFADQWGLFTNINAAAAVIFQGLHTYITPGGNNFILQETLGVYSDNGKPILKSLTTAWLSLAGFQGFERAYRLYLIGQYVSPHVLNVSVAYDFNPNPVQSAKIFMPQNPSYGGNPYYGASDFYGGAGTTEQFRINLTQQKCQSIQITIQESMDTANYVLGAGIDLEAIGVLVGRKLSYPKLPAVKSVS